MPVPSQAALRYKGENGVMKKKFGALLRDIEVRLACNVWRARLVVDAGYGRRALRRCSCALGTRGSHIPRTTPLPHLSTCTPQEGKTAVKASLDRAEALKRGIAGLEREIGLLRGAYARRACAGRGL